MIAISTFIITLSASQGGPSVLCYVPLKKHCCTQWLEEWQVYCNGAACVGSHSQTGSFMGHTVASVGENGHPLIQWTLKGNGAFCQYESVYCGSDGECVHTGEFTEIECHDEILTGSCQG